VNVERSTSFNATTLAITIAVATVLLRRHVNPALLIARGRGGLFALRAAEVREERHGQDATTDDHERRLPRAEHLRRRHADRRHPLPRVQAHPEAGSLHVGAGLRDLGKLARRAADDVGVDIPGGREAARLASARSSSLDTRTFALYNRADPAPPHSRRDGFPIGEPEIVFKFRHPDLQGLPRSTPAASGATTASNSRPRCSARSAWAAIVRCTRTTWSSA
jgi:hypothetical protein